MIIDARQIPSGTKLSADICIIGAGAAGISLATKLARSQFRVCLLESGGFKPDRKTQSLNHAENIGRHYELLSTRTRFLGGGTNCWGGWSRPLDEINFERREWLQYSGWPFERTELNQYYKEAIALCGLRPEFSIEAWEHVQKESSTPFLSIREGRVTSELTQLAPRRHFGNLVRGEIDKTENFTTYIYTNAIELETNDTAQNVSQVMAKTLSGNTFSILAKVFVLAAGAVENARLLLISNKTQTVGLGNGNDLVGRFFMEHPYAPSMPLIMISPKVNTDIYDSNYAFFKLPIVAHLNLTRQTLITERIQNSRSFIVSHFVGDESDGMDALKYLFMTARISVAPKDFSHRVYNIIRDAPSISTAILGRFWRPRFLLKNRKLVTHIEPAPNPNSRVTLSTHRDILGSNKARLDWKLSPEDTYTFWRTQEIISEELERSGLAKLERISAFDEFDLPEKISGSWHQMGTTRMGHDPKISVVDKDCRVHGVGNLFVSGASVFPTVGDDVPTLTIIALALRLADHLKNQFRS